LGSLVARYPAQRLAAARLQTQAACSLGFLPFAGGVASALADGGGGGGGLAAAPGRSVDLSRALAWASQLSATQAGLLGFSACVAVAGLLLQYEGHLNLNVTLTVMLPLPSTCLKRFTSGSYRRNLPSSPMISHGLPWSPPPRYEGQRVVPAASAQPIYAASPALSALWAYLVLSEPISAGEVVGGLGVGCAAWLAASGAGRAAAPHAVAPPSAETARRA